MQSEILPRVFKQLKGLGFYSIELIPVPGVLTTVVKDKIKVAELAAKFQEALTKEKKVKFCMASARNTKARLCLS